MNNTALNVLEWVGVRNALLQNQRELYIAAVANLNMRYRELLQNDFGTTLAKNCARDLAGEIVRRYFDTSDYYITVDQMYDRIVHFSYDRLPNTTDTDVNIRKTLYNIKDNGEYSSTLRDISSKCQEAQVKLFEKEKVTSKNGTQYSKYVDEKLIKDGKEQYRNTQHERQGVLSDELSGVSEADYRLEVDHVQAAATARYNSRYLNTANAIQNLKEFYNAEENFQMLEKSANGSKGDVRIYSDGKKFLTSQEMKSIKREIREKCEEQYRKSGIDPSTKKNEIDREVNQQVTAQYDVTYKVSASQLADAICERWETSSAKERLIASGKLGENGKVPDSVRKKMEENLRRSMNEESKVILKTMDYKQVSKDALGYTQSAVKKIVIGQVIYYALPPLVFETQTLLKKKNMTIESFFKEIKKAGKRIVAYMYRNLGEIFKNILGNTAHKFLKSFFDIIIALVKETVRQMVKIVKQLVISLVNCVRVIVDKQSSPAQKADSVTKILASSITITVLEILFEYAEKQFGLPDILMEPLQIIITILATNLIMLVLQKLDLFDVQYGLLVANIERVFNEENQKFLQESEELQRKGETVMREYVDYLTDHIRKIEQSIQELDLFEEDASEPLNQINHVFNMGLDFDQEWKEYISPAVNT